MVREVHCAVAAVTCRVCHELYSVLYSVLAWVTDVWSPAPRRVAACGAGRSFLPVDAQGNMHK
jgi:hypothetical protein